MAAYTVEVDDSVSKIEVEKSQMRGCDLIKYMNFGKLFKFCKAPFAESLLWDGLGLVTLYAC